MTAFTHLAELAAREVVPGFHGKFVHTDKVTVSAWTVDPGSSLPVHAHPHEQITMVLEGTFEMTVDGETRTLEAGGIAVIPGGTPHSGRAVTPCRLMDVFSPPRDDYR